MRSALLCLHALKALKIKLAKNPQFKYSFADNFDNLIQAVHTMNYYLPACFAEKCGYSLTQDLSDYTKAAQADKQNDEGAKINYFIPPKYKSAPMNLKLTLDFIVDNIFFAIDESSVKKSRLKNNDIKLHESLQGILSTQGINIFDHVSVKFQNRINLVLKPKKLISA